MEVLPTIKLTIRGNQYTFHSKKDAQDFVRRMNLPKDEKFLVEEGTHYIGVPQGFKPNR